MQKNQARAGQGKGLKGLDRFVPQLVRDCWRFFLFSGFGSTSRKLPHLGIQNPGDPYCVPADSLLLPELNAGVGPKQTAQVRRRHSTI